MIHRREFTVAGLSAAALAALHVAGAADEPSGVEPPRVGSANPEDRFEPCARTCSDCQRECDYCATHCADLLGKGEQHHLVTLMSCRDCAELCAAASRIVARHGSFADLFCQSCAEACLRCAKACEEHGKNDKVMLRCAEECRTCEKACRDMVASAGAVGRR